MMYVCSCACSHSQSECGQRAKRGKPPFDRTMRQASFKMPAGGNSNGGKWETRNEQAATAAAAVPTRVIPVDPWMEGWILVLSRRGSLHFALSQCTLHSPTFLHLDAVGRTMKRSWTRELRRTQTTPERGKRGEGGRKRSGRSNKRAKRTRTRTLFSNRFGVNGPTGRVRPSAPGDELMALFLGRQFHEPVFLVRRAFA